MNFRRTIALGLVVAACVAGIPVRSVWAQEPFRLTSAARFLMGMDWGTLWITGETLIPAGGRLDSGIKLDLSSDLGITQGEGSLASLEATILENHLLKFDNLMFTPTGLKQVPRELKFHNRTYPAGTLVESRIDLNWMRLNYGYKLFGGASWWIAPRLGAHYLRSITTLNGETKEEGTISNTRSLDGVYPVLGLEGRLLFPYGLDIGFETEGTHLITRGFLSSARLAASWEVYPNFVLSAGIFNRVVQYVEDNQPLNNEWFYVVSGYSVGVGFGF